MLDVIGAATIEDLFDGIPEELRLGRPLDLPEPLVAERDLRRHINALMQRNQHTGDTLSFLGGGCWQHDVPAVCDTINQRDEFLTAYGGDTYGDYGKYQAIFEFQSLIGELVGMEIVSAPVYDWAAATVSALMMAGRISGRRQVLLPDTVSPQLLSQLQNTAGIWLDITPIRHDASGQMDLADLAARIGPETAAVYVENPGYLGVIETRSREIADLAHAAGALSVVGVDAVSLGVLEAPANYGADIVTGEAQGLGVRMQYSGGLCGFIASKDDPAYVMEYPYLMVSAAPGRTPGEWGFGWSTMARTSYDMRELSPDYTGTTQWLWGITAAAYLALLGPDGLRELGEGITQRAHYAMRRLNAIPGVTAPQFSGHHFKEFVVSFADSGHRVAEINAALRERGIFGGHDLSAEFPGLGQSALYCVTEVHTQADIDRLATTLEEVLA
jgi:glycine dehydrogenase subunit 1